MNPQTQALTEMLPHLLRLIQVDRDYAASAIRAYFGLCPWAEPLIGEKLREAWKAQSAPAKGTK